ncbi:MAG: dihydropteroate synthase [Nakamurella sp.]
MAKNASTNNLSSNSKVRFPDRGLIGVINLANEKPGTLQYADGVDAALRIGDEYRAAGFAALDLGAQSSHYSVRRMSADEQVELLAPVIAALVADGQHITIETELSDVIQACADAGASCINLSGGAEDTSILSLIGELELACITSFTPRDSPKDVDSIDIALDLRGQHVERLRGNVQRLTAAGVSQIIVDAGIGYSYQMPYSEFSRYQVETIRQTRDMGSALHLPALVAVPRIDNEWLIAAFAALAIESGASILRCHDTAVGDVAKLLGFTDIAN